MDVYVYFLMPARIKAKAPKNLENLSLEEVNSWATNLVSMLNDSEIESALKSLYPIEEVVANESKYPIDVPALAVRKVGEEHYHYLTYLWKNFVNSSVFPEMEREEGEEIQLDLFLPVESDCEGFCPISKEEQVRVVT